MRILLLILWLVAWCACGAFIDANRELFCNHFALVMTTGAVLGVVNYFIVSYGGHP